MLMPDRPKYPGWMGTEITFANRRVRRPYDDRHDRPKDRRAMALTRCSARDGKAGLAENDYPRFATTCHHIDGE